MQKTLLSQEIVQEMSNRATRCRVGSCCFGKLDVLRPLSFGSDLAGSKA